jgi:hypothetical protein
MKKQLKNSILTSILLGISLTASAQNTDAVNPNQAPALGQANPFEKEVTPLLREISLKKSVLELRKVEREIEKLDEDALKAQVEREQLLNPTKVPEMANSPFNMNRGVPNGLVMPPSTIMNMPNSGNNASNSTTSSTSNNSTESKDNPNKVKILMIYGFNDNLHAKVSAGDQGGFVVKEGDVMPDGKIVKKITANYIEVQADKKKSKVEKIFVSYTPAPEKKAENLQANAGTSSEAPFGGAFSRTGTPMPFQPSPPAPFLMPKR